MMSFHGESRYEQLKETVENNMSSGLAKVSSSFSRVFHASDNAQTSSDKTEANAKQSESDGQDRINSWLIKNEIDSSFSGLSHKQRMIGFTFTVLFSILCLSLIVLISPILFTPKGIRKAVFLNTVGAISLLFSFTFLLGPMNHLKSLFAYKNLHFTISFLSALCFSLYAVAIRRSAFLSLIGMGLQDSILLYQVFSWIPGGAIGIKYLTKSIYYTLSGAAKTVLPK